MHSGDGLAVAYIIVTAMLPPNKRCVIEFALFGKNSVSGHDSALSLDLCSAS